MLGSYLYLLSSLPKVLLKFAPPNNPSASMTGEKGGEKLSTKVLMLGNYFYLFSPLSIRDEVKMFTGESFTRWRNEEKCGCGEPPGGDSPPFWTSQPLLGEATSEDFLKTIINQEKKTIKWSPKNLLTITLFFEKKDVLSAHPLGKMFYYSCNS